MFSARNKEAGLISPYLWENLSQVLEIGGPKFRDRSHNLGLFFMTVLSNTLEPKGMRDVFSADRPYPC